MASVLPSTTHDALYDNAKFRHRSSLRKVTRAIQTSKLPRSCVSCGIGQLLVLLLLAGFVYLGCSRSSQIPASAKLISKRVREKYDGVIGTEALPLLLNKRKNVNPPKLNNGKASSDGSMSIHHNDTQDPLWKTRQADVAAAFRHAWKGYKTFAMGFDELQPLSKHGVDGLGGLGATVIDALDTAMIMGLSDIVKDAGSWIKKELPNRLNEKGQVNLFETTIRVLGGLLSAYHLSGGGNSGAGGAKGSSHLQGPNPNVYLDNARDLGDRLMAAFTSSPSPVPFSDVILQERSAHTAGFGGGFSSTSEVTTVQMEFWYLSYITGDPKYAKAAMDVYEHFRGLPKTEGLVPIYINPQSGQFEGSNIRLGSRGDSYYEYLLKVWLQQGGAAYNESSVAYLRNMYEEAMGGVKHLLVKKSEPSSLVFVGELPNGPNGAVHPKMDHLVCFLAGNLALGATRGLTKQEAMAKDLLSKSALQDLELAEELAKTCYEMYEVTQTGLAPEIAYFNLYAENVAVEGGKADSMYKHDIRIRPADRHNLLRPETVESLFILYRITEDPRYRNWGWNIFQAFERHTKVNSGGYTSLSDVTVIPAPKRDKMETFFLGETLKYLYLLFGDTSVLPLTQFVFNTEAHPLPIVGGKIDDGRFITGSQDH